MKKSDSLSKFAPAFVRAQKNAKHAIKGSVNPAFKSRYADLAEVIDTVTPVFNDEGIGILQFPGFAENRVTLETMLLHESGEFVSGTAETPVPKQDPQGVGSGTTYLRRYSLAAATGITQDDDDGEGAKAQKPKAKEPASTPQDVRETAKAAAQDVNPGLMKKALMDELEAFVGGPRPTPAQVSGFQERLRALHQLNKELGMAVYGLARKQGVLE